MRNTFYITLLACLATLTLSCDDDMNVNPGPISYPLDLLLDSDNSSVTLKWTEATVSNFEEYIIVRSTDSIPDSPEPNLEGAQQIIERIDQRNQLEFTDFSTPLENRVYYKVFAKIGERFLISPTVRADLSFQIINLRVDAMTVMKDRDELIGFDRAVDVLFRYDYQNGEIEAQNFAFYNNPILTYGTFNGNREVYVVDRNTSNIAIYSAESLEPVDQILTGMNIQDMIVVNGFVFVGGDNSTIAVFRRETGTRLSQITSTFTSVRSLEYLTTQGSSTTFVDVTQSLVRKYSWNGVQLSLLTQSDPVSGGSQVFSARRPGGDEIVAYNTGRIIDSDLNSSNAVGEGISFFNLYDFTANGDTFVATTFDGNQPVLRMYDTGNEYELFKTIPISLSPFQVFGDNDGAYTLTIQFFSGGARTVVSKFSTL